MNQINSVYRHSGGFNVVGVITALLDGVICTFVLGIIYGYALYYIPFVYINFFIVLGYGLAVGFVVAKAAQWGKVRNPAMIYLVGFLAGVVAEYIGWVIWIYAISEQRILIWSPFEIWAFIQLLAEKGSWSIFKWTPTGSSLYFFWAVEAILIVGASTLIAGSDVSGTPYCEECGKWLRAKTTIKYLQPLTEPEIALENIQKGSFKSLFSLKKVGAMSPHYTQLHLRECAGCGQLHLVTVEEVDVIRDAEGEVEEDIILLIENFIIDTATFHKLKALDKEPEKEDKATSEENQPEF